MKRNWDLIRDILIKLDEKKPDKHELSSKDFETTIQPQVVYQVELLEEAGLIDARIIKSTDGTDFMAFRLTWEGHELLDAIRSDNIWSKTKESFVTKGLTMTFDLVKSVAIKIAADFLNGI